MATITLKFDNQTGPGFQKLVQSLQASEAAERDMTSATVEGNEAFAILQAQNQQTVAAIEQTTAAVLGNRDSWVEVTNTMIEFGRNVGAAVGKVKELTVGLSDQAIELGLVESRAELAAAAAQSVALKMLGIAAPVAAATAGIKGFQIAMKHTGEVVQAQAQLISDEAHNALQAINAGLKTVEEIEKEHGLTLDQMGLKYETNWDRMTEATSRSKALIVSDVKEIGKAFLEQQFPMTISLWKEATEEFEKGMNRFANNTVENLSIVDEWMDKLMGRSTELRKEQEKLEEQRGRQAEARSQAKAFEKDLEQRIQLEKELGEISELSSQRQVEAALLAERKKREILFQTEEYRGEVAEASMSRISALERKKLDLVRENAQKAEEYQKQLSERDWKRREAAYERERKLEDEAAAARAKRREEEFEKEKQQREFIAKSRRELAVQAFDHENQLLQDEYSREKGNEEKITILKKQAIVVRANAAIDAAQDEMSKQQEILKMMMELREEDFRHKLQSEQRKTQAAEEAAEKAVEIERQKIDAIKALTNSQGQNLFEEMLGRQSNKAVLEEITRRRLEQSRKDDPDAQGARRRQMDARIRFQTMQDAQQGRLNSGEVERVRGDLAANQTMQLHKQGLLNKDVVKAMVEQAKAHREKSVLDEMITNQLVQIQEHLRITQQASRNAGERLRAQRRGTRG